LADLIKPGKQAVARQKICGAVGRLRIELTSNDFITE
jgi:hypothetical protein